MIIECIALTGGEVLPYIGDIAALRCSVFREYPYLYDGNQEAEAVYLSNYSNSDDVLLVLAKVEERVVGVSTCMAMSGSDSAFKKPFLDRNIPIDDLCYFGESVLLPEFRGMRIGHQFFDLRENWSRERGFKANYFCSVIRPDIHPFKPADYWTHDFFWQKRGYWKIEDLIAQLEWREINDPEGAESLHKLVFWSNAPRFLD
jgi:hypothetical protein